MKNPSVLLARGILSPLLINMHHMLIQDTRNSGKTQICLESCVRAWVPASEIESVAQQAARDTDYRE
jgi:hypothetical protein